MRIELFYLFLAFLVVCEPSCTEGDSTSGQASATQCVLDSSARFEIDMFPGMSHEYRYLQMVEEGGREMLIGISRFHNQLECVALESGQLVRTIPITSQGPDAIPDLKAFYYLSEDSIFLFSDFRLGLADAKGRLLWSVPINTGSSPVAGLDVDKKLLSGNAEQPIFYDPDERSLYFGTYSIANNQWQRGYYEGFIGARVDVRDWTADTLPLFFHESYLKGFYGLLNQRNITFLDDKIVFNFNNASDIFVYDKKSGKVTRIDAPSRLAPPLAEPYAGASDDVPALLSHARFNPIYLRVFYDPVQERYYRPVLLPAREPKARKRTALTVFDKDFNRLADELLPGYPAPYAVATPGGLLMHYPLSSSEETGRYLFFRVLCAGQ